MRVKKDVTKAANAFAQSQLAIPVSSDYVGALLLWSLASTWNLPASTVTAQWQAAGLEPGADLCATPGMGKAFAHGIIAANKRGAVKKCKLYVLKAEADGATRYGVLAVSSELDASGKAGLRADALGVVTLPYTGIVPGTPFVEKADIHG